MKQFPFLLAGVALGIVLTKSEAISWYRIQEMFHFHSFHMYGIIGSAVILGILLLQIMKRRAQSNFAGYAITYTEKPLRFKANFIGGVIFGLGWALTGACPGPLYTLLGNGYFSIIIVIIGALLGSFVYGMTKDRLPH